LTATVVAVWLVLAAGYGVFFSFSIFMVPLLEEFRWSRALTAGALSVSTLLQGLLAPLVGIAVDRLGPRPVILAGVFSLSTASILAATIRTPWELYFYTGVVSGIGMVALGWVPMGVLLSRWVVERRGWVVGVAFSGMGMGVFVLGPLAQALIDALGWRAATATLGAAILIVVFPIAWWGCRDPKNPRPKPADARGASSIRAGDRAGGADGRGRIPERMGSLSEGASPVRPPRPRDATLADALRTRAFWALFAAYFMTPLAVFPIVTHQVAFAVDLGFPRLLVASLFGVLGLMSVVGRVLFGLLADRAGGAQAATLSYACTAAGAIALVAAEAWPHTGWLIVYALLFGLGFGARGPIITAIASDLFGGARFGVIWGALNLSNGVGGAIGPWYGGIVHDVLGSYRLVFLSSVVFSVLGSLCFWLARRRAP
jgi:MFS family permease